LPFAQHEFFSGAIGGSVNVALLTALVGELHGVRRSGVKLCRRLLGGLIAVGDAAVGEAVDGINP
jgi:hypothetical protein